MRKLLIVTTVASTLRAFLLPFVDHFRNLGWQVDGLTSRDHAWDECLPHFDNLMEVNWSRNPIKQRHFFQNVRFIRTLFEREMYDIVHVHTPIAAFITRFALRKLESRPRVIYTAHGFHFHSMGNRLANSFYLSIEKLAGRWTDYLITINNEDYENAIRHEILPRNRVRRFPGIGVDFKYYDPNAISEQDIIRVRSEMGISKDAPLFLMVASFDPGKRHRDALRAFKNLRHPNAVLAFAGIGRLQHQTEKLANKLGIKDNVRFLGYRRDIPALMKASSAVVLPSEREGLPRSIMEAMCLGVPVIATRIRGIVDLLSDDCGQLVSVGDFHQLSRAMGWVIDNYAEAKLMGERARRKIEDYSLERVLKLHEVLYNEVLYNKSLRTH